MIQNSKIQKKICLTYNGFLQNICFAKLLLLIKLVAVPIHTLNDSRKRGRTVQLQNEM